MKMRKKESLRGKKNEKEDKKIPNRPRTDGGEREREREEVTFLECAMEYGGTVIACWCIRECACVPEPVCPGTDRWSISGDGL